MKNKSEIMQQQNKSWGHTFIVATQEDIEKARASPSCCLSGLVYFEESYLYSIKYCAICDKSLSLV